MKADYSRVHAEGAETARIVLGCCQCGNGIVVRPGSIVHKEIQKWADDSGLLCRDCGHLDGISFPIGQPAPPYRERIPRLDGAVRPSRGRVARTKGP